MCRKYCYLHHYAYLLIVRLGIDYDVTCWPVYSVRERELERRDKIGGEEFEGRGRIGSLCSGCELVRINDYLNLGHRIQDYADSVQSRVGGLGLVGSGQSFNLCLERDGR